MAGIAAGGAPAGDALPFLSAPHDSLRYGLPALKADVQLAHPVQAIQANATQVQSPAAMQAHLYGTAFPARAAIERQILSRVQRLPGCGIPSSRLGLEVLSGELDDFSFESYLGFPGEKEALPAGSIHSRCEAQLGLTRGAAPLRPGM